MWQPVELASLLKQSRAYTVSLLDAIDAADYFRQPAGIPTHVGWQVGHLAIAEYRLCLERLRGARPSDAEFLPADFLDLFGKGSTPVPDASRYPTPAQLRQVLDAVHAHTLAEVAGFPVSLFDEPVSAPHPMFTDKGGAVRWAAMHEMLHAGQIGLLRRLWGAVPLR
jgi:hypothetical protein